MLTNFSVYIYIVFCKEMDHQVLMLEFDANNPPHAPPQGGGVCARSGTPAILIDLPVRLWSVKFTARWQSDHCKMKMMVVRQEPSDLA